MEFLLHIMGTFHVDRMMLILSEKLITYLSLPAFRKEVQSFVNKSVPFLMREIATVIINQSVKLMRKVIYLFKKKNPDVQICETMV